MTDKTLLAIKAANPNKENPAVDNREFLAVTGLNRNVKNSFEALRNHRIYAADLTDMKILLDSEHLSLTQETIVKTFISTTKILADLEPRMPIVVGMATANRISATQANKLTNKVSMLHDMREKQLKKIIAFEIQAIKSLDA